MNVPAGKTIFLLLSLMWLVSSFGQSGIALAASTTDETGAPTSAEARTKQRRLEQLQRQQEMLEQRLDRLQQKLDNERRATRARPAVRPAALKQTLSGSVIDAQRRPIAGAEVRIGATRTRTDTQGRFRVQTLQPGPHQVSASARGYRDTSRRVELQAGASQTMTLVLAATERKAAPTPAPRPFTPVKPALDPAVRPAQVIGQVLDPGRRPIPGAEVEVGSARTRTDKHGRFAVPNLKPGRYQVSASARGYRDTSRRVELRSGARHTVTLVLAK